MLFAATGLSIDDTLPTIVLLALITDFIKRAEDQLFEIICVDKYIGA